MKRKKRLVDDWQRCWRWLSVQCMTAALAVQGAWMFIPDDMKTSIPPEIVRGATMALLALGIAGRLKNQTKGEDDEPK
jgi:hypothetical protein